MPIYVASNFLPKSLGPFPVVEDTYMAGGFRTVATTTDRDSITAMRRREGMLVFVRSDSKLYQLDTDLTTWRDFYDVGGTHLHPNAGFEDGFMSAADKAKLDGIEEGANAYVHPIKNGDGHVPETNGDTAGQILVSGPGSKDYSWQPLPALTITSTHVVASEAEMLALSVEPGDVAVRTDLSQTFILRGPDATVLSDWQELLTPAQGVTSVSAVAPVAVTGDAKTPTISMPAANASQSGYLSAADWATFNGKGQGSVTNVSGTGAISVTSGGTTPVISIAAATTSVPGTMSAADKAKLDGIAAGATAYTHPTGDGNLHVPATGTNNAGKVLTAGSTAGSLSWVAPTVGTVTSVSASGPIASSGGATPIISIPAATSSVDGYLKATDWSIFNGKQDALGFTPYNATNPNGYTSNTGTVTSVTGSGAISVATGTTTPVISIAAATTSVPGTMSAADKTKLDGIATGANAYTHPTGDGNLHVPATSTTNSGKVLTAGATAGSLSWAVPVATTANLQVNSLGVGTAASGTAGDVRATGDVTAFYSDGRLKTVIGVIDNALERVMSLRGVLYTGNEVAAKYGYPTDVQMAGVIAQEVQAVLPEVVTNAPFDTKFLPDGSECSKSGEDYLTVKYDRMIPLLIEAIKEQQRQIEELKTLIQK